MKKRLTAKVREFNYFRKVYPHSSRIKELVQEIYDMVGIENK